MANRTGRRTLAQTRAEVVEVERRIRKLILWASRDAIYYYDRNPRAWVRAAARLANLRKIKTLLPACRGRK